LRSSSAPASPSLILAFDTSAAQCAAALLSGDRVLARRAEAMQRGQAERLLPMLEEVLAEAGTGWSALDAVAVCTGPGNFTGIRLSVAAARGIALALGRPAIGVSRFEAMAEGIDGAVLALIEAPHEQVHAMLLRDGLPSAPPHLVALDAATAMPGTTCIGHGAAAVAARLGLPERGKGSRVDPAALARLAATRCAGNVRPVPLYLREPDAAPASSLCASART
jgi:tRNA threonylcarbamoyladenosine biosynthesis protein TsaB